MTLVLEWFLNPDHLPFVVAKDCGFFRREGLEVSILIPTVPEESLDLVARRKADFGIGEQTNLIRGRDRGQPLISLGPLLDTTVVCLMYLKHGPIKQLADLRGRRVGWPGLEIDLPILGSMLESVGLSSQDIVPVDVGFALTDALLTRKADAVFGAFVNYEQVEADLKGAQVEFVSPTQHGVPELYQLVLLTSEHLVTRSPQTVKKFCRAITRALAYVREQPDDALARYLKANTLAEPTLSQKTFRATLPYFPGSLSQSPERWGAVRDWLHRRGVIGTRMPLSRLYTNRFVPSS